MFPLSVSASPRTSTPVRRAPSRRWRHAVVASVVLLGLSGCALPALDSSWGPAPHSSGQNGAAATQASKAPSSTPAPHASKNHGAAKPSASTPAASKPSASKSARVPPAGNGADATALASLAVKGRAPKTGYARDQFGPAWADVDRNGCDTRNDILTRDLTQRTDRPGTRECVVLTGVLADPYTGTTINFERGQTTSTKVQIDHVIALSDAWQKGAQKLSAEQRKALANDPLNLLAVDGPTNGRKSDGDAATWLPPRKAYRCTYVARQIAVKRKYSLYVTKGEKDAMQRVLSSCPKQALPRG